MCKPVEKCSICQYRDSEKGRTPCVSCSDNSRYISHFKEDSIVTILREAWDITDDHIVSRISKENA